MKYDKSLEQVWKWKNRFLIELKISHQKQLDYIEEQAKQVEKFSVRLKNSLTSMKLSSMTIPTVDLPQRRGHR